MSDKDYPQRQKKKAVVVLGRFQPPHLGHQRIIDAAKKEFRLDKLDGVFVVVIEGKKSSEDKKRNPLTGEQRLKYLKKCEFMNGVQTLVASNVFEGFGKIRECGYEPVTVVGGKSKDEKENRAESYKKILDKYFEGDEHKAVSVERDHSKGGIEGLSGTAVRLAVETDQYEQFKDWVVMEDEEDIKELWEIMKQSMGENE